MVTHPLDLNSKRRPPPRSFDWVFYVNVGIIVLFFSLFGSRFILSPALVVDGTPFNAPVRPHNQISYVAGTMVISIKANGQIFIESGLVSPTQLRAWLEEKIKSAPDASVLLRADASVPIEKILEISAMVTDAGFTHVSIPVETTHAIEGQ